MSIMKSYHNVVILQVGAINNCLAKVLVDKHVLK
jgi:hypothetical protein